MAAELVNSATSDKLLEVDWTKNIEICELVSRDSRKAKDIIKAIKKCLGSKSANKQLYAVSLLEMLINNIGEPVHQQVVDKGILRLLVKIVKKKSGLPVREKIFLLLDAAQTSVGGASGKFPQYYSAYYELVSAGVQFPQRSRDTSKPDSANNKVEKHDPPAVDSKASAREGNSPQAQNPTVSESSILEKAGTAFEVLSDVLEAIDTQNPEGAKDEFTLDLVEQCSFEKQRVMHLAVTSRDEKIISRAVEINEQLDRVLHRHDALLSRRTMSTSNHIHHVEEEEEEEAEQLFRRMRKGKACVRPEDEANETDRRPFGLMGRPVPGEMINRPLIRPLTVDRPRDPPPKWPTDKTSKPFSMERNQERQAAVIPPPPAKHVEREKFFQEKKTDGNTALNGHMRSLSLQSGNVSSSHSGSTDFSE